MSCYRTPSRVAAWQAGAGALPLSPPVRVRRTRGWPLVPAVRRLGSKAQYVGSLAEEETEHDATAALITLVATHMLNVHPVMLATATAAVAQWRPQRETERKSEREREMGGRRRRRKCRGCDLPTVAYNSTAVLALAMQIRRVYLARSSGSYVYANAEDYRPEHGRAMNQRRDLNFIRLNHFSTKISLDSSSGPSSDPSDIVTYIPVLCSESFPRCFIFALCYVNLRAVNVLRALIHFLLFSYDYAESIHLTNLLKYFCCRYQWLEKTRNVTLRYDSRS